MSTNCYHCLEPVPKGFIGFVSIDGNEQPMCCIGCQSVAQTIVSQGMTDYYKFRTVRSGKVEQLVPEQLELIKSYDNDDIQKDFISEHNDLSEVLLTVEGITCAACAWLIEKQLLSLGSIKRVDVNTSTNRAMILWDKSATPLSEIIESLHSIGYKAYPFQADLEARQKQQTAKAYIRRLGVAGLMTMQVMMFAFAMYFGMFSGMEDGFEQYFRWISLVLATPVILYSALPFLTNAINGLKAKQLNMDLPVSLAIFGAYGASCYATLMSVGEVYFESICMFTFLLLLGKYLEFRARLKATEFTANLQKLLPLTARLLKAGEQQIIAAKNLQLGDNVLIKAGETIPADGVIVKGHSTIDEAMMTGEHFPVNKTIDDQVFAGTVNHDGVIEIEINKVGQNTLLNQIIKLQHTALSKRPRLVEITDKVAQWFVACLLLFASITALGWYQVDPEHAFWITISVLVATCPCALSLAIPTALTCAIANLTKKGVLIKQAHVLETLPKLTDIAFDKTGTLTQGRFSIKQIKIIDPTLNEQAILNLAAQLEHFSEHPIANAFAHVNVATNMLSDVKIEAGSGIIATSENGDHVAIGKSGWFNSPSNDAQACLYINKHCVAQFYFTDSVRDNAHAVIAKLQQQNINCHMLTGDGSNSADDLAKQLNFQSMHKGCSPKDKQLHLEKLSQNGAITAMVGDGVNDSPVFASSHLSIAMETGADISKNSADVVLLNSNLAAIEQLLTVAKQTRRVVKQNLTLSLLYNGSILPLAALGLVAPWMAVIGMSASSILVISNSLRLLKL